MKSQHKIQRNRCFKIILLKFSQRNVDICVTLLKNFENINPIENSVVIIVPGN